MSVMRVAMVMAVVAAVSHHVTMHMMPSCLAKVGMVRGRTVTREMRRPAFHGDGRERLNREAQYQQHDDEEFAPI
ncbi:hypothetical protein BCh11DRAFT_07735 [Burkholderia sp. Ch1-1]|nr:hypothetical protein BCh11DRAFT_07735 [Burkholderia sp. Ch1-1]